MLSGELETFANRLDYSNNFVIALTFEYVYATSFPEQILLSAKPYCFWLLGNEG